LETFVELREPCCLLRLDVMYLGVIASEELEVVTFGYSLF